MPLTKEQAQARLTELLKDPKGEGSDELFRLLESRHAAPEHISQALKHEDPAVRIQALDYGAVEPHHVLQGLKDPEDIVRRKAALRLDNVEDLTPALDSANDPDLFVRNEVLKHLVLTKHPGLTAEHLKHALEHPSETVRQNALRHPNLSEEHITQALQDKDEFVRREAIQHPKVNVEHITQALQDEHPDVRQRAIQHPKVTPEHITQALQDEHPDVRDKALQITDLNFPDAVHDESVTYQPNTEHFRQYRRAVEQHGGPVHKKDFAAHGIKYEHVARLLNHKGELTQEKLSEHIEAQPKHKFNVSHDVWEGAQRHNEDISQTVFQLNLTNEHINKMRNAGVYDTFRQIHEASRASGHPTRSGTVGWVRYNASSGDNKRPAGLHIDEIQSDLGRSIVKQAAVQAKAAKAAGEITEEQANEAVRRANQKYPDSHLETIKHILFGEHQPERVIHEAFHQHMRNIGMVGGEIHINSPELKGKLAGMQGKEPLPVHIQQTYGETPKKPGYKPNEYGKLSVQDTIAHQGDKTFSTILAKMRKLKEEIALKKAVADDFVETFRKYDEQPNDCETGADRDQILRDKKKKRAKQMEEQEKFKKSDEIGGIIPIEVGTMSNPPTDQETFGLKSGYVSADGDNIGSTVEQSVLANDVEGIRKQSDLIRAGQDYLRDVMSVMGAEVIVSGGDDNLFKFTHFPTLLQLEEIRKEYEKRTGYTITMGIAPEMREAVKALVYGKLTGKNRLEQWRPELEEKLHALAHPQKEEEKMREHGMLKSMAVTPEQYDDPYDNTEVLLEEHRRLVERLKVADPELLDDELKIQSEELEAMKAAQDMSPKRKAELLEEHERLVDALTTKDPKKILREREIQEKELEELEMEEEGELVEMDPDEVMRASTPRWRD